MKQKILPTIILLLILFVVFFLIYLRFYNEEKINLSKKIYMVNSVCEKYKQGEVKIDSKNIVVDIADDNCKRKLGLSGRLSVNDDAGMIFIFDKVGNYGFWMENMNFPIDILWVNDAFKVVGIEKEVSPDTYPKSFGNKYLAKYVLEVSAGYSDKNNIKIGDKIIFTKN
ncbi:MAG: DUF192 domain-containing protein [Candidatus Paceibacterota bacterium]|jgi:hypothetical protein